MDLTLISAIFVACIVGVPSTVLGANIVFYFGVSSYSHRVPAWPLAEALAEQGHNVTFVSPFPAKNPNPKIRDYVPKKLKEWTETWGDMEDVYQDRKAGNTVKGWILLPVFGEMACDVIYTDDEFLKWVKDTTVDLVFVDALANECAYGMAFHWKSKIILFDTTTAMGWHMEPYGLPDETSWISDMALHYPVEMTFFQRLKNALIPIVWDIYRKWKYFPTLEQLSKDKLNLPHLPKFEEIEKNTSLVFINTHYSEEFARSLPPNVISIGGIAWTGKRKPLPKELDEFLKRGSGFIYLSFGTYADFLRMDAETQDAIVGAIRSFPNIQFVWKVGNDSFVPEFPDRNIYINKWMPQQDILAHPNIKAFITHSGLLGIQEAIQNAVPLVSFPIFAEQDYNAERIHRKEYGIRLEITTVTQAQLEDAINRVLTDPKYVDQHKRKNVIKVKRWYTNNMKKLSKLFKERQQEPLASAMWWTDFVLRHSQDELETLRPLSVGQPWWKKRQLDVWTTVIAAAGIMLTLSTIVILHILKYLYRAVVNVDQKKSNESRKKKVQ